MHPNPNFFSDPIDEILAEIVIRVQLPPSKYAIAVDRYHAICKWLERDGSPLKGKVDICYPQGSMATGSTIAARGPKEEYDIDTIAALLFSQNDDPEWVLDQLFLTINGEEGSLYYGKCKRRSRCVTIYYADGMHLDVTPAVRSSVHPLERTSHIFHNDPDKPREASMTLLMNAYGFCEWFKARTKDNTGFAAAFGLRSRSLDLAFDASTVDPVAPQEHPSDKSTDVVSLQLIKRNRNTKYTDREGRMPPSVMLSRLVGDAASPKTSLFEALRHHVRAVRDRIIAAERKNDLLHVTNPMCDEDVFTDRWPLNRSEQQLYLSDLTEMLGVLDRIAQNRMSILEIQEALIGLFGEYPVKAAVRAAQETFGQASQSGSTTHRVGGGVGLSAAIITAPAAAPVFSAPRSTNYGVKE